MFHCLGSDAPISDFWQLDTSTLTWEQHLPVASDSVWPPPCADSSLVKFHEKLFLMGGDDLVLTYGFLYSYDLITRTWHLYSSEEIVGSRISPRFSASMIVHQERMLILSGYYYVPPQQEPYPTLDIIDTVQVSISANEGDDVRCLFTTTIPCATLTTAISYYSPASGNSSGFIEFLLIDVDDNSFIGMENVTLAHPALIKAEKLIPVDCQQTTCLHVRIDSKSKSHSELRFISTC